jgi:hypothetical protein
MKHRFATWVLLCRCRCGNVCSFPDVRLSSRELLTIRTFTTAYPRANNSWLQMGKSRLVCPREAVYLAWGSPDQRVEGAMRREMTETWIYVQYTSAYPYGYGYGYGYPYGYGGGFGFGGVLATHRHHGRSFAFIGDPFYDPFYYSYIPPSIPYPYRTVTFANGRVVSFQSLVGPYRY